MTKKENSEIFNRLLSLKKEGYTYLTSSDGADYTGYDRAVADCYEDGDGNEPSYGDWIRDGFGSGKYVTFHERLLIHGQFTHRADYEAEVIELDYNQDEMREKERCLQEDFDTLYVDLMAYSIWNFDFENENQTIDSIEEFSAFCGKEENHFFGAYNACTTDFITVFVKVELWNDVSFIEHVLNLQDGPSKKVVTRFLSKSFMENNDVFYIQHFPEDLSIYILLPDKYPTEMRNALEKEGHLFKQLPEELKKSKELALLAVKGGASLAIFNNSIKSDTEIIKIYISRLDVDWDTNTLEHVSEELKANKDFMISLVSQNSFVLKDVSDALQNDKDVVIAAIKNNGAVLEYASDELKADKDVVMTAVSNPNITDTFGNLGCALEHASDELKADKEIVMAALTNDGGTPRYAGDTSRNSLQFASDELKANKEVVMFAVSNGGTFKHASEDLKTDKEVVMATLSVSPSEFLWAPDEVKANKEVVLYAVKREAGNLRYASDELKADRDVVIAAVSNDKLALRYASEKLQNDPDIIALKDK
ncbi:MAG: DUF4116 domain-containing protein [Verrucomicrobiales bacterium]|nr:DUF4116 domain-containing protein [Verrucomicrobiales bacterium]